MTARVPSRYYRVQIPCVQSVQVQNLSELENFFERALEKAGCVLEKAAVNLQLNFSVQTIGFSTERWPLEVGPESELQIYEECRLNRV